MKKLRLAAAKKEEEQEEQEEQERAESERGDVPVEAAEYVAREERSYPDSS